MSPPIHIGRNDRALAVSISVLRIAALALAMCACRSAGVRSPPAVAPTLAPPTDGPTDTSPTDGPICEPGIHRFDCEIIDGQLIHPEGVID
jgi:hypothetical protein